ncbi:hypothetical protein GUL16_15785 [Stenotrophomonas maltophilia]|nr:hypothetical protein [Stenotrophomonas maltophilia]
MSNDNKTLADVQPGGGVRLGNQAERPRFEAWGRSEGLPLARAKLGGYAFEVTAKAWLAWQYLSAQPSPGGQDVLFIEELAELRRLVPSVNQKQALDAAIAALAARQPVGVSTDTLRALADRWASDRGYTGSPVDDIRALIDEPTAARQPVYVQGSDELRARTEGERAAYMEGLEEGKKIAARQPVEAAPQGCDACDRTGVRQNDEGHNICCPDCDLGRACAGQEQRSPAQAVDLGQFRRVLLAAIDKFSGLPADATAAEKLRELLALIDSQAVGK